MRCKRPGPPTEQIPRWRALARTMEDCRAYSFPKSEETSMSNPAYTAWLDAIYEDARQLDRLCSLRGIPGVILEQCFDCGAKPTCDSLLDFCEDRIQGRVAKAA